MPVIPFKQWVPDSADLGNPGSPDIVNAVPKLNSYGPMPSLVVNTNALDGQPLGAIESKDQSGNIYQYAGDASKLYSLSGSTWGDVSQSGGYSTGVDERWEFVRWKNKVLATNFTDSPQQITFGGTNFADLTTALEARHLAVVRDFVVAGNTNDAVDGEVRDRVRWSAVGDETDWTVSTTTQAGYRDLNVGGAIQRIIGGDYGVVVSEKSIFRMVYVGSPQVFEIDETIPGAGALCPGAVALLGGTVYVWSEHGMLAIDGGSQVSFIGEGRVDQFLRQDLDEDNLSRISSVADPTSGKVFWAYPGAGNTAGLPNKVIMYDRILNKWGYLEQELELIWRAGGVATTLEQLDSISSSIDALGSSLDSAQWKGGSPVLAAFDSTYKNGNFDGNNMTATLTTTEVELNPGRRTALRAFSPLVDGGTVTGRIGKRRKLTDSVDYSPSLTLSDTGRFTTRSNSRFHRFELTVTGEWDDAIGIEVDRRHAKPSAGRG